MKLWLWGYVVISVITQYAPGAELIINNKINVICLQICNDKVNFARMRKLTR